MSSPPTHNILICHRGALGDFVLLWPAILCLKRHYPQYSFIGLGRPDYMRLAVKLHILEKFYNCETAEMNTFFNGNYIPEKFRTIDTGIFWLATYTKLKTLLEQKSSIKTFFIKPFPSDATHVAIYHLKSVCTHFNIKMCDTMNLYPSTTKHTDKKTVLIHPGSGSPQKCFTSTLYHHVVEGITTRGYSVRFILGSADTHLIKYFKEYDIIDNIPDSCELSDILCTASLFIGNDSGVSHLAGALGIPTIALYKSTDPQKWGVMGKRVSNIYEKSEEKVLQKIAKVLDSNI